MASTYWEKEEVDFILKRIHLETRDIVKQFNATFGDSRSYDSIQKKVRNLRNIFNEPEAPIHLVDSITGEEVEVDLEWTEFDSDFVDLDQEIDNVETSVIKQEIDSWLRNTSQGFTCGVTHQGIDSNNTSLVVLLSDLHFGKRTKEFNLEEANRRILSIVPQIVSSSEYHPAFVDEVNFVLAGDIVEGEDIFASQNGGLECPVIVQAKRATQAIWRMLLDAVETFKCPVRVHTVPGNHGRMSKSANPKSNWDNVVYMMLGVIAEQANNPMITVDLNFDEFCVFQVKDKIIMANHKGTKHLGTPAMQVKFAGWLLNEGVDCILHGHWHTWNVGTYLGRPMISNGSMCGPDDLSMSMAKDEPARQAYFFVEPNQSIKFFSYIEW